MKKKLLITGANGFIGKSIIELLDKSKYEIIPITKPSTTTIPSIYEYDIQDESDVDRMFDFFQNIDYVVHCATVGGRRNKPETPYVFASNVTMFNNLIKHQDKYKHMVTFGSGAEKDTLSYYGLSKKFITELVYQKNLPVTILRLWGCFGKYETDDRFIKANIIRYINKEDIIIHANKKMEYYYVNDIVPILDKIFLKGENFSELNLGYGDTQSLYSIAEMINKLDNYKVNITLESNNMESAYYPFPAMVHKIHGSYLNLKKLIGLEKGIREVYEYLKSQQ